MSLFHFWKVCQKELRWGWSLFFGLSGCNKFLSCDFLDLFHLLQKVLWKTTNSGWKRNISWNTIVFPSMKSFLSNFVLYSIYVWQLPAILNFLRSHFCPSQEDRFSSRSPHMLQLIAYRENCGQFLIVLITLSYNLCSVQQNLCIVIQLNQFNSVYIDEYVWIG